MKAVHKGGRGRCSVCEHRERAAIDAALLAPGSLDGLAAKYGLSRSSLQRHKANHVARPLGTGERDDLSVVMPVSGAAVDIPAELQAQFARTLAAVQKAQRSGSHQQVDGAHREHRLTLDALADWENEQRKIAALSKTQSTLYLRQVPGYTKFRMALLEALLEHDRQFHQHITDTYNTGRPSRETNERESARTAVLEALDRIIDKFDQGDTND